MVDLCLNLRYNTCIRWITKSEKDMNDNLPSRDWLNEDYEDFEIITNDEGIRVLVDAAGNVITTLDVNLAEVNKGVQND